MQIGLKTYRPAVFCACILLAACGGGGGGPSSGGALVPPPSGASATPSPTASPVSPNAVTLRAITPSSIENGIDATYDAADYVSAPVVAAKNELFVFLPGTGGIPHSVRDILREGAVRGYHVAGLDYVNGTEVNAYCALSSDPGCWGDVRNEIVYGTDSSPLLAVAPADSIVARLTALLSYLNTAYPSEGWGQFLAAGSPVWSKIVVGGHSQGAGHAAYLAKSQSLAGICTFDSPDDGNGIAGPASWLSEPNATPVQRLYGFTNQDDAVAGFAGVTRDWSLLGFPGSPYDVDASRPPYGSSHQLYTVASSAVTSDTHGYTVVDAATPLAGGVPAFTPVWDTICFP